MSGVSTTTNTLNNVMKGQEKQIYVFYFQFLLLSKNPAVLLTFFDKADGDMYLLTK